MQKKLLFTLFLILYHTTALSSHKTSNMVTIHGILNRQLPNSDYWLTIDQKMPGCWIVWQTEPDNKTGNPLAREAIIITGLGKKIAPSGDPIYHQKYLEQVRNLAQQKFDTAQKFNNKSVALQFLKKLYNNPEHASRLQQLANEEALKIAPTIENKTK